MSNLFHVIKDPVHGTMQFTSTEDRWVKPFIDSPSFQRLRHIKQLGMGDLIFPGAVHTRFNHSLGCCYVASQIAHKIGLADEERQLVMIACLLHDIGHGPFSHTFEGLFKKPIRHEDWTPYFLNEYSREDFFVEYNRLNPRYHLTEEKFNEIARMIMHAPVARNVLGDIVSSQLDADRLDYLLRDSHFCGVRYGEFDFRWMLHCLAIVETDKGERLGITHKGIGVVEHYLMARRLMIRNIYQSQKKLAIEALLVDLLAYLAKEMDAELYEPFRQSQLSRFLSAVNQYNQAPFSNERKQQFLKENFKHYQALCDYDIFSLIKELAQLDGNTPAIEIAKRLQHRIMPKIVRLEDVDVKEVEILLTDYKQQQHIPDWQLKLIQSPHQAYTAEEPIFMINEQQQINPVSRFSFMINAISDKLEQVAFIAIDKTIADKNEMKQLLMACEKIRVT